MHMCEQYAANTETETRHAGISYACWRRAIQVGRQLDHALHVVEQHTGPVHIIQVGAETHIPASQSKKNTPPPK